MMNIMMNTRVFLLAGLLLSGCAGMHNQEHARAEAEGRAHADRLDREYRAQVREANSPGARERDRQAEMREERKREDYKAAIKKLALAVENGKTLGSDAFAIKMELDEKTFGPPTPDQRRFDLYVITVVERMEAGEITQAQMNYLIAEKKSEIAAREQEEQARAQAVARAQADRLEVQAWKQQLLQLEVQRQGVEEAAQELSRWQNFTQHLLYQQPRYRAPVTCYNVGSTTTCY